MSAHYAFEAKKRDRAGKGIARALRREGRIPAVIYGDNKEPVLISLDSNTINVEYVKGHMFTSLCEMDVEGSKHTVLARDIQLHPVTDVVEHADFLRVTKKTQITVSVPVHFINEEKSPGLSQGGMLQVIRYEVDLVCPAMEIPEFIEVDLEGFETGDTIKISNVKLPAHITPAITDRDFSLASINAPKRAAAADEEATPAEAGEASAEGAEAGESAE